ncbi:hypothetical protein IKQ21_00985, partial [bacterium]|nr:hypothetical protein [bacterium]
MAELEIRLEHFLGEEGEYLQNGNVVLNPEDYINPENPIDTLNISAIGKSVPAEGSGIIVNGTEDGDWIRTDSNPYITEVNGGKGNDDIHLTIDNATIRGGDGNDEVYITNGTNNVIYGGKGNDKLDNGGKFDDEHYSLPSTNTFVFNTGDGNDVISAPDSDDITTIFKFADSSLEDITLEKYGESLLIKYSTNDSLRINNYYSEYYEHNGILTIVDKDNNDISLDDFVSEYSGVPVSTDTVINGADGGDYIRTYGKQNITAVNGGNGNDNIRLQIDNATIRGGDGNDEVYITNGTNNIIYGGKGNDRLENNGKNDGEGYVPSVNTFVFNTGDGNDIISSPYSVNTTTKLKFADSSLEDITLEKYGESLLIKYSTNDSLRISDYYLENSVNNGIITIVDKDNNEVALDAFVSEYGGVPVSTDTVINAADGGDWIRTYGNTNIEEVNGGNGNDNIRLQIDNATIRAGEGNDEIYITNGTHNIIYGGKGNDILENDGKHDSEWQFLPSTNTFVFNTGDGNDIMWAPAANYATTILKFADSSLEDITLEKYGNALLIKYNAKDSLRIKDYYSEYYEPFGITKIVDKDDNEVLLEEFINEYGDIPEQTGYTGIPVKRIPKDYYVHHSDGTISRPVEYQEEPFGPLPGDEGHGTESDIYTDIRPDGKYHYELFGNEEGDREIKLLTYDEEWLTDEDGHKNVKIPVNGIGFNAEGDLVIVTNLKNVYGSYYSKNYDRVYDEEGELIIDGAPTSDESLLETTYRSVILKDFAKNYAQSGITTIKLGDEVINLEDLNIKTDFNAKKLTLEGTAEKGVNDLISGMGFTPADTGKNKNKGLTINKANAKYGGSDEIFGSDGNDTIYASSDGGEVTGGKGNDAIYIAKNSTGGTRVNYYFSSGSHILNRNDGGNIYDQYIPYDHGMERSDEEGGVELNENCIILNSKPDFKNNGVDTIYNSTSKDSLYVDIGSPVCEPVFIKSGNDLKLTLNYSEEYDIYNEYWINKEGEDSDKIFTKPSESTIILKDFFKQKAENRLDTIIVHSAEDDYHEEREEGETLLHYHWVGDHSFKLAELMSMTSYGLYIEGKGKLTAQAGYDNYLQGRSSGDTLQGTDDYEHLETFAAGAGNDTIKLGKGLSYVKYNYFDGKDKIQTSKGGSVFLSYGVMSDDVINMYEQIKQYRELDYVQGEDAEEHKEELKGIIDTLKSWDGTKNKDAINALNVLYKNYDNFADDDDEEAYQNEFDNHIRNIHIYDESGASDAEYTRLDFTVSGSGGNITFTRGGDKFTITNFDTSNLREFVVCFSMNEEEGASDTMDLVTGVVKRFNPNVMSRDTKKYPDRNNIKTTITGTNLNEYIEGSTNDDKLSAGGGRDLLIGDGGKDTLTGGAGINVYHVGDVVRNTFSEELYTPVNSGNDTITLGKGQNILYFSENAPIAVVKEGNNIKLIQAYDENGKVQDSVLIKNYFNNTADNVYVTETLNFHNPVDYMAENEGIDEGDMSANFSYGALRTLQDYLSDNDLLDESWIDIDKSESKKAVTINGTILDETLTGGSGGDTIKSNGGIDTITGNGGNDKLYGGDGVTIFDFEEGDGKDTLYAGKGENFINFEYDDIEDKGIRKSGNDVILTHTYTDENDKTKKDTITIKNYLKAGTDNVSFGLESLLRIMEDNGLYSAITDTGYAKKAVKKNGTGLDDTLYGSAKADTISSGDGDDTIYAGAGNDKITVGARGNKYIDGGEGNDTYNVTLSDNSLNTITDAKDSDTLNIEISGEMQQKGLAFWFTMSDVKLAEIPNDKVYGNRFDYTAGDLNILSTEYFNSLDLSADTDINTGILIKDYFSSNGVGAGAIEDINLSRQIGVSNSGYLSDIDTSENTDETKYVPEYRQTAYLDNFYFNNLAQSVASWIANNSYI